MRFSKGLGLPAHLSRVKPGIGFGYLHGPNPADHMKAEHDWIASSPGALKKLGVTVTSEPFALDPNKVEIFRATQIYYSAMDSLSLCMFIFGPGNILSDEDVVKMVNAATGFDYSFRELMQIGEQAIQLQRKLHTDFGGADETLPPFMEKEIPDGPTRGNKLSKADFEKARKHYYTLWGWDSTTG
jgi:aldehyde:ferredoxin oxidoreductase